ncbi:serine/threonine-protein kinase [Parenemella sanctibonifatiensis]|uniref:Uncharacterized protein n=1 Tax=Parenemella sanctibonifatiensis TaxID=2016505 RepID=A0A255E938_9ACTN|nr:hypothetical protein [Parenemella sanctibonifatiensis]OYN87790.1 hypothetical protein CGZ92_05860 [Parenemella sanctibonifatiensis]
MPDLAGLQVVSGVARLGDHQLSVLDEAGRPATWLEDRVDIDEVESDFSLPGGGQLTLRHHLPDGDGPWLLRASLSAGAQPATVRLAAQGPGAWAWGGGAHGFLSWLGAEPVGLRMQRGTLPLAQGPGAAIELRVEAGQRGLWSLSGQRFATVTALRSHLLPPWWPAIDLATGEDPELELPDAAIEVQEVSLDGEEQQTWLVHQADGTTIVEFSQQPTWRPANLPASGRLPDAAARVLAQEWLRSGADDAEALEADLDRATEVGGGPLAVVAAVGDALRWGRDESLVVAALTACPAVPGAGLAAVQAATITPEAALATLRRVAPALPDEVATVLQRADAAVAERWAAMVGHGLPGRGPASAPERAIATVALALLPEPVQLELGPAWGMTPGELASLHRRRLLAREPEPEVRAWLTLFP